MSRPKVAFVGSGGATKGIAHVGVLKALEELDISADIFVGSSSGAIAGTFFSQGVSADQMVDWFRPFWKRATADSAHSTRALSSRSIFGTPTSEQWRDFGWLSSGLFSVNSFEESVRKSLPTNDFRLLDKTLLITATDIDGRGRVVFGKGHIEDVPISQAVAASSAIPVLYRPYKIGDRFFVDGELVRTLSIDLAVEAGADVVIISNVYRPHIPKPKERSIAQGGAAKVLRQAANIVFSEKEKRGIDLIHRLHPNVTILNVSADLGGYSFLSGKNTRNLLLRGYREALRVLAPAKDRGVFGTAHEATLSA